LLEKEKEGDQEGDEEHKEHEPILEKIEKFTCLINGPLELILPVKRYPEIAFLLIFVIIYFMCEFILTVFNVFSVYTGVSHFFVGLTLMVWGSDNLELINYSIAVKNKKPELGMASVLTC
jgi:Ca2+/Na+ antiporter